MSSRMFIIQRLRYPVLINIIRHKHRNFPIYRKQNQSSRTLKINNYSNRYAIYTVRPVAAAVGKPPTALFWRANSAFTQVPRGDILKMCNIFCAEAASDSADKIIAGARKNSWNTEVLICSATVSTCISTFAPSDDCGIEVYCKIDVTPIFFLFLSSSTSIVCCALLQARARVPTYKCV